MVNKALHLILFMLLLPSAANASDFESLILAPSKPAAPAIQQPVISTIPRPTAEKPDVAPVVPPLPLSKPKTAPPARDVVINKPVITEPENTTEQAVSSPDATDDGDVLILPLPDKMDSIPPVIKTWLDDNIVTPLQQGQPFLLMTSYASPTDISEVSGRRVALSKGLLLREYLLSKGIAPNRVTLKAVSAADNTPAGQPDARVEFFFPR